MSFGDPGQMSSSTTSSSSSSSSSATGPGLCYYQWYNTPPGWQPIPGQNNCHPGYYAKEPSTPGTYDGEVRNGSCAVIA